MGLANRLAVSNARAAIKQGEPMNIVTISCTGSTMPKQGNELLEMGYKLHSITNAYNYYTWHFVLPEVDAGQ